MAKKRPAKPDLKFQHSPFKSLRGLSVSVPETEPQRPVKELPGAEPDEVDIDFPTAMTGLGINRIGEREAMAPLAEPAAGYPLSEEDEEGLFLEALGRVDKVFKDEIPEEPTPQGVPRRMKQLRQGRLHIEAELDLHGMDRFEARRRVLHFVADCHYRQLQTLRVITGKGLHSAETAVLRDAIEALLRDDSPPQVADWGRAPTRLGGAGALILFLRAGE